MIYYARSASAKRLILNTLISKREHKARHNAKLAHQRLEEITEAIRLGMLEIGYQPSETNDDHWSMIRTAARKQGMH